jgi:hypothetical protein
VGHGFRNFANYRLRLLLHCGVTWQTHRTASLRSRAPLVVVSSRLTSWSSRHAARRARQ